MNNALDYTLKYIFLIVFYLWMLKDLFSNSKFIFNFFSILNFSIRISKIYQYISLKILFCEFMQRLLQPELR